jgi:hypothetical protein
MPSLEQVDLEFDIDSELEDDEHSHAVPFCFEHKTPDWFPVSGTIVQVLCGRLIRIKQIAGAEQKKCEDCKKWHGKTNCHVCGKEIYG